MKAPPQPPLRAKAASSTSLALQRSLPQRRWKRPSEGRHLWGVSPRKSQAKPAELPGGRPETLAVGWPRSLAALAALGSAVSAAAWRPRRNNLRRWWRDLRRRPEGRGLSAAIAATSAINSQGAFAEKSAEKGTSSKFEDFLKNVRLFRTLPLAEFKDLARSLKEVQFDAGQTVVKEGDPGSCMYIVRKGRAQVTHSNPGTTEKSVIDLSPGEWFGEYAMLWGGIRRVTCTTTTPVKLLVLERNDFNKVSRHAQFAVKILCAVRYPSVGGQWRVWRLGAQLLGRLLLAFSIVPLATAWLYGGHLITGLLLEALGMPLRLVEPTYLGLSILAVTVLSKLLPIVAVCVEALEMMLLLRKAPLWQVVAVEKLAEPLVQSVRLALLCLFAEAMLETVPAGMSFHIPAFGTITSDRGCGRIANFVRSLWFAVTCTCIAKYLWEIKRPPTRSVDDESPPNTFGHLVEQYYTAIKNPRKYRDERFADLATTFSRLTSGLIIFCGILPWMRLFGVNPAQVMTLGGFGGIAVGFAAKEVLQNLVSGILLQVSRPFVEGDRIRLEGTEKFKGVVRKVGLAYSQILRDDGELLLVPNAEMLKAPTVNRSRRSFRVIRSAFPVATLDEGTLESLCREIEEVMSSHPKVLCEDQVREIKKKNRFLRVFAARCHFQGYGHQGAQITVTAYVADSLVHDAFMAVQSDVLLMVNGVLEARGASIGLEAHHLLRLSEKAEGKEEDADSTVHNKEMEEQPAQSEAQAKTNGKKTPQADMSEDLRAMVSTIDEAKTNGKKSPQADMSEDLRAMVSRIDEVLEPPAPAVSRTPEDTVQAKATQKKPSKVDMTKELKSMINRIDEVLK